MGEHAAFRIKVFSSGFQEICRFVNEREMPVNEIEIHVNRVVLVPSLGISGEVPSDAESSFVRLVLTQY